VDRLGGRRFRARRTQLQRSMRPLGVVVRGILGEHSAEVPLAEDQHPSVSSDRTVKTKRSAKQFARAQRRGISTTSMPAAANTASNDAAN